MYSFSLNKAERNKCFSGLNLGICIGDMHRVVFMMLSPAELYWVAEADFGKTSLVTKGRNLLQFI